MMLMLLDEPVIEIFESAAQPPNWIEAIDVENGEFLFCDDQGQRYEGTVSGSWGWFRAPTFELRAVGDPDIANALALVGRAVAISPNSRFADLEAVRSHVLSRRFGPEGL